LLLYTHVDFVGVRCVFQDFFNAKSILLPSQRKSMWEDEGVDYFPKNFNGCISGDPPF
jgi:hypothetical protein